MKRLGVWILAITCAYLATGLYVVRGNEQALVRRFGRARLPLVTSGLHLDLPWPFVRLDRVNVNQVRTLALGVTTPEPMDASGFLRDAYVDRQGEFLTGDKNVLNLAVTVQYRIVDPHAYLCRGNAPENGLRLLVESLVTDVVARSGVDYVHPLGLSELRGLLTERTRDEANRHPWGVLVEDVTISGAFPPVEVKASFLDVSNARAEKDRVVNQEQAQAEKRLSAARAAARQRLDRAETERHARIETAKGAADRFLTVIAEFRRDAESSGQSTAAVRRRTMQRLFSSAMEQLLSRFAGKVLVDPHDPVELLIIPAPETRRPDPAK